MAAKVKALQQWCKMQCEGYRDVSVVNMTSSWKSGLAFCAIIHRYRPELIDYDSLSKENVFQNNKLAFDVAQQLGIPALLDAEDMVVMTVPDKLCIITYVSQYYNFFRNYKPATPVKRHLPDDTSTASAAKKPTVEKPVLGETKGQNDLSASSKRCTLEDTCNICQGKVFLMERQIEGKKLYHRHCLRNMQKEQSSTLRSAQQSDGEQRRGLDQFHEMRNETMEYDELHSDVATGEGECGNASQVPVSKLDETLSSGNKKTTVGEVSVGATHDLQVTSIATTKPSTAVTSSTNKSAVLVTSALGTSSISSVASSATLQSKAGAISSPVVTSVLPSHVSHAEERTYTSDKSTSKPAKPVDSSEGTNQLTLAPASHDSPTSFGQFMPVSSNRPTQSLPLTSSPSGLPSKASNSSESPSAPLVQVPLRPKLPPTIIPQQSGASVDVSPSSLVPPKPPRCSVVVETIPVEAGKGQNDSLAEMSTPSVSQSFSDHKVVSVANITFQKPDCNIPVCKVGDAMSSVQTTSTIHSSSTHTNVCSSTLSPKTRPAPNPPDQAVSISSNLVSTSTNLPSSNSTNLSISTSTNLPISNSTNLPVSTSTNLPISNSTNLPTSTMMNIPVSTPASSSVPVTTLRSIRTSKSHPAPSPPSHSVPFSATPSLLSLKTNSSYPPSTVALSCPAVSTSESLPSSTSTTLTTASSSSVPKPAIRHHISTPAINPVSTPAIEPFSTPAIHPVSTPEIHPISAPAIYPTSAKEIHSISSPAMHPVSAPEIHPISAPAIHPVSTPHTPSNGFGGNSLGQNFIHSSKQKPEAAVSHSSSSHVISTQSVKSPISHPGKTPPGRPVLPPSGLPGQVPGTSKASPAVCAAPVQSSSTSTSATSASSTLHSTLTQPSDKSLALPAASPAVPTVHVEPLSRKESSDTVAVIPTKETNEQIVSEDTSQNVGQFAGQVDNQSAVHCVDPSVCQSDVQSGGKHPPIPKRPPSISVSREIEKNKPLPVKLDIALDQRSVANSGHKDNRELKENKDPVENEALVNGATVDPRPDSRRSVRTNPFNSPEPPSSVNPDDFHGKLIKDQKTPGILKNETLHKIEELPKKNAGIGDTNKDMEKILVKPSPSPRSILKVKSDAPVSSPTQSESNSSIWYVDLEPEDLRNETGSGTTESPAVAGTKLVPNELGHGMVEEIVNQQKTISVPVPLPRSRSKKGKDDVLPMNGDAEAQSKLSSPSMSPTAQPSNSIRPPADGTTSPVVTRAAPPRPTPPRPESIKQALKKITPDTTFTFEDQSFNFGPTSGSRKPSDGRELHMRSSAVASNHKQPVVKRKVNAEGRLSAQYITEQLRLLDITLKKLETEGRVLEGRIRSGTDESMDDDDKNDLMGQWFEMINHKNDLVRQESELIYRCRQQELEDKHEEVEFELRCLMNKPDHLKTANEKKREEVLLQKLLQTVTQRNNIVESMEEDRIRFVPTIFVGQRRERFKLKDKLSQRR